MKRFFCSDHHFGHAKQFTSYGRKGIFSSNHEMTEFLIKQHNAVVKPCDTVYFVGDFTFLPFEESKAILSRLNGAQKILVQGNHCLSGKRHISVKQYFDMGFTEVVQEKMIKVSNGLSVLLKHYPYQKNSLKLFFLDVADYFRPEHKKRFKKYHAYFPCDRGFWLIHGHIHRGPKILGRQINVNVDSWDFKPVSESEICKMMNEYENTRLLKKIKFLLRRSFWRLASLFRK